MDSPVIRPNYYGGISGLQLPIPKYRFPEPFKSFSRLQYYATIFNSIEINSTFYKLPRSATLGNWASSVGNNFRFTYKLFQGITHINPFSINESDIDLFMKALLIAGNKSGCLLIQFPPSIKLINMRLIDLLLTRIRKSDPKRQWQIAVEFRDRGWYEKDVYDMLQTHNANVVIHDKAATASPLLDTMVDFVYLRFHGPSGDYGGSYNQDFLYEYAGYIDEWLRVGKTVYVYFNNTMGDAFNNLQTLNKYVQKEMFKL